MNREQDERVSEVVRRERGRLHGFIRRRVPDPGDAEDILQEVFYELAEANRLLMPIEHVTGWLFRVARNRITDLFRRKRPVPFADLGGRVQEPPGVPWEELLPSLAAGPEVEHFRAVVMDEIERAIAALPDDQRRVFVAHELEGRSFKELAEETGVHRNTLLSRKHQAVLALRERLRELYESLSEE